MSRQPLYRTIAEHLEREIYMGVHAPEQPLPPEPVLESRFQVSRITIRQAIALLKQRGLVYVQHGKGTMIRSDVIHKKSLGITGSINDLVYYTSRTDYTPIEKSLIVPDKQVAATLGTHPDDQVFYICGTRSIDPGQPVILEELYCRSNVGAGIENRNLWPDTVFSVIEKNTGIRITEVRQELSASAPSRAAKLYLKLIPGRHTLRADRYYKAQNEEVVIYSVSHYDTDRFRYVTTLYAE